MSQGFDNKNILVIGGSSGIGRGIAESFIKYNANVCITGTRDSIEDYEEREREIDSLRFFIERQAGIALDSYKIAERLKLRRRQAVEYSNIARTFERMGDHTHQMAALILEDKGRTKLSLKAPPLNQIPIWQGCIL